VAKTCIHRRRFQVSFLGKRKGDSGIWCADCGQRLAGHGRLSPRKLAIMAELQAPLEAPDPSPDFELDG
jgi:hypothetical protein